MYEWKVFHQNLPAPSARGENPPDPKLTLCSSHIHSKTTDNMANKEKLSEFKTFSREASTEVFLSVDQKSTLVTKLNLRTGPQNTSFAWKTNMSSLARMLTSAGALVQQKQTKSALYLPRIL